MCAPPTQSKEHTSQGDKWDPAVAFRIGKCPGLLFFFPLEMCVPPQRLGSPGATLAAYRHTARPEGFAPDPKPSGEQGDEGEWEEEEEWGKAADVPGQRPRDEASKSLLRNMLR